MQKIYQQTICETATFEGIGLHSGKNSKVKLFIVKDNPQLAKFIKKNIYGKKIVIGMGAGTISNWMKKLPEMIK